MLNTATKSEAPGTEQELTDGFHLVIDALKLNGINTIYNVPGIPITDLGRMAQAEGIRVISFRHEQNAGYAAGIAGYLTKKPGVCLTVSAPGFLNGLTALAHATTNCYPMILISGSSEREIVDLQQGDYEEMDQLAIAKPLCKAAYRVLHAQDIGIGLARAIRAAVSGRPGGVYLDLPAKLFGQVMNADAGQKSLVKVIDAAPAQIPSPASIKRALDVLKSAKRPLIILGKGAAYAQADEEIKSFVEKSGVPFLPMSMAKGLLPDTHPQCAGAARSTVLKESDVVLLIGARLNWLLSHGKGKSWGEAPKKFIQVDIEPREMDSNVEIVAPVVGDIGSVVSAFNQAISTGWTAPPAEWTKAIVSKRDENVAKMAPKLHEQQVADGLSRRARRAEERDQGSPGGDPRQRGRQHARPRPRRHRHVQAAQAPRRRHLGRDGHRHGPGDRGGARDRPPRAGGGRRLGLRLLRHGGRDHLPLQPSDLRRHLQQ
ncbi:oxalyl-CoA decarboxylase [Bradyrhizobium sp. S3.14.4]